MIAGLPYDAEVEYLESTGTQYIDLSQYFSGKSLGVTIKWCPVATTNDRFIFGGGQNSTPQNFRFGVYGNNNPFVTPSGETCKIFIQHASHGHFVEMVDRQYIIIASDMDVSDAHVYLFCQEWGGVPNGKIEARLFNVKFYLDGELYGDFIPVRFTNELGVSEGAMYDRVSRKLFRNAGTGSFTIGPDVATPVMGLHFMKSPAKTARDYVQDGLIAMWDGIENAGWGVHDPNATTWKDMVGSNDLTIYGNVLSNCISNIGLSQSAAGASFKIDGISTIEACHEYQGGSITYGIIANTGGVDTSRIGLVHYGAANAFQTYSNIFWAYPEIENQHAITLCGTTAGCYVNGNELQPVTHSADSWNNGSVTIIGGRMNGSYRLLAKYFCVRFYSRDLTAAEIAHNFAVDKERFNLP